MGLADERYEGNPLLGGYLFSESLVGDVAYAGHVETVDWLLEMNAPITDDEMNVLFNLAAQSGKDGLYRRIWEAKHYEPTSTHVWDLCALENVKEAKPETCPLKCPLVAALKKEENWKRLQSLRRIFHENHLEFLEKSRASATISRFANQDNYASHYRDVWKEGKTTINRILSNVAPANLKQVFGCLQVARAMNFCVQNTGGSKGEEICSNRE